MDLVVANAVAGLGATAQKICGDIRHLASWKEIEEYVLPMTMHAPFDMSWESVLDRLHS